MAYSYGSQYNGGSQFNSFSLGGPEAMAVVSPAAEKVRRHPKYYLNGGDVHFLVENYIFRVHRYFFERESLWFREKLGAPPPPGQAPKGSSDVNPFALDDILEEDFSRFLWVFYNPLYSVYEANANEWISILKLSHQWSFSEIKQMSCRYLERYELDPIRKIELYQAYDVDKRLLIPAYTALVNRAEPLTLDDGRRLTLETALLIATARECARGKLEAGRHTPVSATVKPDAMVDIIKEVFSLPDRTPASPSLGPLAEGRGPSAFTATPMSPSRIITAPPLRDGAKSPTPTINTNIQPLVLTPAEQPRVPVPPTPSTTVPLSTSATTNPKPSDSKLAPNLPPYLKTSFSQGPFATGAPNTPLKSAVSSDSANAADPFGAPPTSTNGSAKLEIEKPKTGQSLVKTERTSTPAPQAKTTKTERTGSKKSKDQQEPTSPKTQATPTAKATRGQAPPPPVAQPAPVQGSKASSAAQKLAETRPTAAAKEAKGENEDEGEIGRTGTSGSSGYYTDVTNSADDAGVVGNEIHDVVTSTNTSGPEKQESKSQNKNKSGKAQGSAAAAAGDKAPGKAGKNKAKASAAQSTARPEMAISIPPAPSASDAAAAAVESVLPQLLANNPAASVPTAKTQVPPATVINQSAKTEGVPESAAEKAAGVDPSATSGIGGAKKPVESKKTEDASASSVDTEKSKEQSTEPTPPKPTTSADPEAEKKTVEETEKPAEPKATAGVGDGDLAKHPAQTEGEPNAEGTLTPTTSQITENLPPPAEPAASVEHAPSATDLGSDSAASGGNSPVDESWGLNDGYETAANEGYETAAEQELSSEPVIVKHEDAVNTAAEHGDAATTTAERDVSAEPVIVKHEDAVNTAAEHGDAAKTTAERDVSAEPVIVEHEDAAGADAPPAAADPVAADAVIVQREDVMPAPTAPETGAEVPDASAAENVKVSEPPAEQKDEANLVDPAATTSGAASGPAVGAEATDTNGASKVEPAPTAAEASKEPKEPESQQVPALTGDEAKEKEKSAESKADEPPATTTTSTPPVDEKAKTTEQPATPQAESAKSDAQTESAETGAGVEAQQGAASTLVTTSPKPNDAQKAKPDPANASASGPPPTPSKTMDPKASTWAPPAGATGQQTRRIQPATPRASSRPASVHSVESKPAWGQKTPTVTSPPVEQPPTPKTPWSAAALGNRMRGFINKVKDTVSEDEHAESRSSAPASPRQQPAPAFEVTRSPSQRSQDQTAAKPEAPKSTSTHAPTTPPAPVVSATPVDQKVDTEKNGPQEKAQQEKKEQDEEKPSGRETPSRPSLRVNTGGGADSDAGAPPDDDDVPLAKIASSVPKRMQQDAEETEATTESEPPSSRPESPEVDKTLSKSQKKKLRVQAKKAGKNAGH